MSTAPRATALYPYGSVGRDWSYGYGPWRGDILYFGLNVPADVDIERIAVYRRPFLVQYSDWTDEGNIANPSLGITAENFMDSAELVMELGSNKALGSAEPVPVGHVHAHRPCRSPHAGDRRLPDRRC